MFGLEDNPILLEARSATRIEILQASVTDAIQRNFNGIEMSYLVPDTIDFIGLY